MNVMALITLADILLTAGTLGVQAISELKIFRKELEGFEGRDPTPEEWGEINGRLNANLSGLRSRRAEAEALLAGSEPE